MASASVPSHTEHIQHSDLRIVAEWAEVLRQELRASGVTGYEVILPKPEDHPGDNSSRIDVSFYRKKNPDNV